MIETVQAPALPRRSVPSLRANFAWTLAGNVLYGACQWGMLSMLAKQGSPSIVGQFTLGLAISAPIFMFTNLQLRAVQATDVNVEHGFGNYFTLRLLATFLGLAVIVALLPLTVDSSSVRAVIILIAVSKCFECMSDVTAGLLQREEQLKKVAISLMLRGSGSFLLFSVTFARWRNLALSVTAMCAVWFSVVLFYDLPNAKALIGRHEPFFHFDRREIWRLTLLGLPLGWVATLGSLNANIPRYFLQHYMGLADQGIYASLAYLVIAISLVVFALTQSVTTRLAHLFADRNFKQFVALLTRLSMLGLVIVVAGVPLTFLAGRPLLTFLYRPEYGDHVGLLALLVAIAGLSTIGSFLFCGLTAARRFQVQLPIYFSATLVAVAGSAILVPRFGLMGGGIALLFSALVIVAGGWWVMRSVLSMEQSQL